MKLYTPKLLAMVSAVALGVAAFGSTDAQAQTTVNASFITSSAITVNAGNTMDFGEYLLIVSGGDNPTLTLSDDGTNAITVANAPNSQAIEITAPVTEGSVTVETPAPAVLVMTRDAASTTDFADAGLSLTAVTYRTATETGNIDSDTDTGAVTTVAGATPETVTFGGTITATATPADTTHTASYTVSFAY